MSEFREGSGRDGGLWWPVCLLFIGGVKATCCGICISFPTNLMTQNPPDTQIYTLSVLIPVIHDQSTKHEISSDWWS